MDLIQPVGAWQAARAAFALLTAGFLPGLFLYSAKEGKKIWGLLSEDFFETVGASATISACILALLSAALAFSIGFSAIGIAVAEALVIFATAWFWWTRG